MRNAAAISVVVPVFNAAAYLRPMMASLLGQTELSLEILTVDDGSTDDSAAILREYARLDPRIVLLRQANLGISAARNLGLAHATGVWIAFVDSDDWLDPRTLALWRERAEAGALELVIGNGFRFDSEPFLRTRQAALLARQPWDQVLSGRDWIVHAVAQNEWPHFAWLQLIRHDFLKASGARFTVGLLHEDIVWTTCLALAATRIGFVAEPLYGYRDCATSITNSMSAESIGNRAASYLHIVRSMVASSDDAACPLLKQALLCHAGREGNRFARLMRRRLYKRDPERCRELAGAFLSARLGHAMFRGATTTREFWRALRCHLLLRRYTLGRARAAVRHTPTPRTPTRQD